MTIFVLKNKPKHFTHLLLIPLIILLFNIGHYLRTYQTFGNPISNDLNWKTTNEIFNFQSVASNVVRNISLNLTLPNSKINSGTREIVQNIHDFLKIDVDDSKTTLGDDYFIHFSLYETRASNTLHFFVIVFCILIMMYRKKNFDSKLLHFLSCIGLCFLIFSALLKWQPWGNRLLLPIFILFSPIIGIILSQLKSRFVRYWISILIVIYSIPYLVMNDSRPLVARVVPEKSSFKIYKPYIWNNDRDFLYFTAMTEEYKPFKEISEIINKSKCKAIGLISDEGGFEYALWVLLKKNNERPKIYYLDVQNQSSKLSKNFFYNKPCAIIQFNLENTEKNNKIIKNFENKKIYDEFALYY